VPAAVIGVAQAAALGRGEAAWALVSVSVDPSRRAKLVFLSRVVIFASPGCTPS
jgi:hypothetical protein